MGRDSFPFVFNNDLLSVPAGTCSVFDGKPVEVMKTLLETPHRSSDPAKSRTIEAGTFVFPAKRLAWKYIFSIPGVRIDGVLHRPGDSLKRIVPGPGVFLNIRENYSVSHVSEYCRISPEPFVDTATT